MRSPSTRVPYRHNSLVLGGFFWENQSNIHMKKAMQPRPAANRLFKERPSARLFICLTAKFHPPLPLPVLPRDSLRFADLPYPTPCFPSPVCPCSPHEHPLLFHASPIAAGTQSLAGLYQWVLQGAVPPILLAVTQFLPVQPWSASLLCRGLNMAFSISWPS